MRQRQTELNLVARNVGVASPQRDGDAGGGEGARSRSERRPGDAKRVHDVARWSAVSMAEREVR